MLTMDDKYARGTTLADGRGPDVVTLYSPDDGIALGTVARVNVKEGQMKGVNEKKLVSRGLTFPGHQ